MTAPLSLALDVGTTTTRIALDDEPEGERARTLASRTPAGNQRAVVSAALAAARLPRPAAAICLAVPDAWLAGDADGAGALEAMRQACQDELGTQRITWTGQLAAIAALAMKQHGPGRYLVCDVGAAGVRVAALGVTSNAVRIIAVHSADGGGWRDFDAAVGSLPSLSAPLPADWYLSAIDQERRARRVFEQAVTAAAYREARAYTFDGQDGSWDLSAGQLIDCFAPTRQRLRAGIAEVLGATGTSADVAVLAGGLGWFPLVSVTVAEAARVTPFAAGLDAAARGALLFARDEMALAPPAALARVAVPSHRIRDGLLEEVSLVLPWTEPFAAMSEGPLMISGQDLLLEINGRQRTVALPWPVQGPCKIGVRSGWSGAFALVARPDDGVGKPVIVSVSAEAAK